MFDLVKAKPSKPKLPTSASSSPKENKDPINEGGEKQRVKSSEEEEVQRGVKRKNTCSDDMEAMDVVEEGTPKKRASLEMFIRRKPVVQELNKIQEEDKELDPVTPATKDPITPGRSGAKAKDPVTPTVAKAKDPVTPTVAKAKEPVTPKSVTSKKSNTPKVSAREEGVTPKQPPTTPKTPKQCSPMESETPVGGDGGSPSTLGNTTPVSSKKVCIASQIHRPENPLSDYLRTSRWNRYYF